MLRDLQEAFVARLNARAKEDESGDVEQTRRIKELREELRMVKE